MSAKSELPLLLLLLLSSSTAPTTAAADYVLYKDPRASIEDRVSDLLSRMTLAEKIGQMTQIDRIVAPPDVVRDFFIGSILNGGDSAPKNASPSMWADMIDGFQKAAFETRLGIPIIYGTDAVHGHNNVVGATIFPHNIGLGAARDEDLMVRIGKATALEVKATGVPYTFAPCIAVCRDPRWGRCYESYSEDTEIVRSMSKIILGLQGSPPSDHPKGYPYINTATGVVACAKHYAGDGGTTGGINENNTVADYPTFFDVHMRPYIDAVSMGVSTVMASYSSWNGVKMHANRYLLTRVLKREMGFMGFIISDWEGVDRISTPPGSHYRDSVRAAINAGIDMVMVPHDYPRFIGDLTDLVNSGEVPMSRIDDAVTRVLRVKFVMGLFEKPMADRSLGPVVGRREHRELAREAVRKSLVLLKNGKPGGRPLLPLDRRAGKILVAGSHADDIGYQCGGWTITWAGGPGDITNGTTILQGIKKSVSMRTQVVHNEKPDAKFLQTNSGFSYAIVVVGEKPYVESGGDDDKLELPKESLETIETVCGSVRCLVIIVSGRPITIETHVGSMDGLVAAWLPGSEAGDGIADVIFGRYEFQGRLPRTWFRRVDQLPMNVGDERYDPLYPFGFGLEMGLQLPKRGPRIRSAPFTSSSTALSSWFQI
ncbi:Beta-D-xylosidase 3 [Acorus calamus]|uniref:Beta-D-xylosidase 3 n=1 Tax=Acorus calamus TaxID=4465 RepID=A0AAV9E4A8_ACOCL|nr:Beta-D-xylosidase 3 [Acorus calamus]